MWDFGQVSTAVEKLLGICSAAQILLATSCRLRMRLHSVEERQYRMRGKVLVRLFALHGSYVLFKDFLPGASIPNRAGFSGAQLAAFHRSANRSALSNQ